MEGAPEHPTTPPSRLTHPAGARPYIRVVVKHSGFQRQGPNYYPTVEHIFRELSRQTKTKLQIPEAAKQIDFSIVEPLTD